MTDNLRISVKFEITGLQTPAATKIVFGSVKVKPTADGYRLMEDGVWVS